MEDAIDAAVNAHFFVVRLDVDVACTLLGGGFQQRVDQLANGHLLVGQRLGVDFLKIVAPQYQPLSLKADACDTVVPVQDHLMPERLLRFAGSRCSATASIYSIVSSV